MKKLAFILIFFPLLSYSQDTTRIPFAVAKKIMRDLIDYDQTKTLLSLKDSSLKIIEMKVVAKDSIIRVFGLKETNYLQQIEAEKSKAVLWQQQYKIAQANYKKQKLLRKLEKLGSFVIMGGLGYLYLTK